MRESYVWESWTTYPIFPSRILQLTWCQCSWRHECDYPRVDEHHIYKYIISELITLIIHLTVPNPLNPTPLVPLPHFMRRFDRPLPFFVFLKNSQRPRLRERRREWKKEAEKIPTSIGRICLSTPFWVHWDPLRRHLQSSPEWSSRDCEKAAPLRSEIKILYFIPEPPFPIYHDFIPPWYKKYKGTGLVEF